MASIVQATRRRVTVNCPKCGRGLCSYRDGTLTLRDNNVMRRTPELWIEPESWGGRRRERFRCGNPRCHFAMVVLFDRLFRRLEQAAQAGRTELTLGVDL
jgi:hypothetical protein